MKKIVEMRGIVKNFPYVRAIDGADFDLYEGEIHSLIGENGAGKSTMMKILYGLYSPDAGTIKIRDKYYENFGTHDAIDLGIGMVHQEFMLVKEMTVLENIILGFEPLKSKFVLDVEEAKRKIREYIDTYHLDIQLDKKVLNISVGEAQRVEIIKTLYRGADILILDEPTAVLTPQESQKLFEILETMRKLGKTIVFISHKLPEVMQISDRITVMRHAHVIETVNKSDTDIHSLARMMVGREVFLSSTHTPVTGGQRVVLDVKNINVPAERELSKIRDLSFTLHEGEVLGVAGVDGNGQSELGEALAGLKPIESGQVLLNGVDITHSTPGKIRKAGLTHIPEDRNLRGLDRIDTIGNNLIVDQIDQKPFSHGLKLNIPAIRKYATELVEKFDIRPRNIDNTAQSLSGGNAQKIIVARECSQKASVLIAAQPTRGVDIGSTEAIRAIIEEAKAEGTAVLLISADLNEILSLSDRIIVMYEGSISGELQNENVDEEYLGLLMTGGINKNAK